MSWSAKARGWARSRLACDKDAKRATHGVEGMRAALAGRTRQVEAAGVQAGGCAVLSNLACDNDANRVTIVAEGGLVAAHGGMGGAMMRRAQPASVKPARLRPEQCSRQQQV